MIGNDRRRRRFHQPGKDTIAAWLDEDMAYTSTWIYDRVTGMGCRQLRDCQTACSVRELKQERRKVACTHFETEPGGQAQV